MKKMLILVMSFSILVFGGCNNKELEQMKADKSKLAEENAKLRKELVKVEKLDFLTDKLKGVKVKIVTNMGDIDCQFYPEKAPIHVWNFITRAESGYYDNTKFHRIIPGFMIQGGDPNTKTDNVFTYGQGGPIAAIPHEFNEIHHRAGILSMARVSDPSMGAGSQFFIMHGDSPHLDNQYTVFGEVVAGMDVVNNIAAVETNRTDPRLQNQPVKPVVVKKMVVSR
jgi:peptidyl-prolyl cis-trans isomerase B (cyclophilin B)